MFGQEKFVNFNDEESYNDNGIYTCESFFVKDPNRASQKLGLEKGKQMFKKYINNGKPDVIHVHSFLIGELALWIKENYEIPYVITEHSTSFERKLLKKHLKLAKKVFENSQANIAVSQSFANLMSDFLTTYNFRLFPTLSIQIILI